jgi:hypothetical protein
MLYMTEAILNWMMTRVGWNVHLRYGDRLLIIIPARDGHTIFEQKDGDPYVIIPKGLLTINGKDIKCEHSFTEGSEEEWEGGWLVVKLPEGVTLASKAL